MAQKIMGNSKDLMVEPAVAALWTVFLPFHRTYRLSIWKFLFQNQIESQADKIDLSELKNFDILFDNQFIKKYLFIAQKAWEFECEQEHRFLLYGSSHYPKSFFQLKDSAPPILVLAGNTALLEKQGIAIIGTRTPTEQSARKSFETSYEFAKNGEIIVSGLATGIDTWAHQGALEAKGKTIATLPCPISSIYPSENSELANQIKTNNGCLLTEYPFGKTLKKKYFIERDKHQALLSHSIYLIESEKEGGAMHTMRFGKSFKKKLYVFYPDNQNEQCFSGNKEALRMGAEPIL